MVVYEAMLANQETGSIRTIAAVVGMNRGTTFEVIKKLVRLGLAYSYYKGSRQYYRAETPEKLEQFAIDRSRSLDQELDNVARYAQRLSTLQPEMGNTHFNRYYDGEDEIAVLLQDVLQTVANQSDRMYRVISSAEVSNHLYAKFRNFTRQRIKLGVSVEVIGVGSEGELAELAERKRLAAHEVPASYVIIYGSKVAQITLTDLGSIQGSLIDDPGIAELQKLLFDALWITL